MGGDTAEVAPGTYFERATGLATGAVLRGALVIRDRVFRDNGYGSPHGEYVLEFDDDSHPTFEDCLFLHNRRTALVSQWNCAEFVNCTFATNQSGAGSSGILRGSSTIVSSRSRPRRGGFGKYLVCSQSSSLDAICTDDYGNENGDAPVIARRVISILGR